MNNAAEEEITMNLAHEALKKLDHGREIEKKSLKAYYCGITTLETEWLAIWNLFTLIVDIGSRNEVGREQETNRHTKSAYGSRETENDRRAYEPWAHGLFDWKASSRKRKEFAVKENEKKRKGARTCSPQRRLKELEILNKERKENGEWKWKTIVPKKERERTWSPPQRKGKETEKKRGLAPIRNGRPQEGRKRNEKEKEG
jgi:hypothetical protein